MATQTAAQQRVVLVTGGMGGLGETISTKMVDAGYKVIVTYSPSNTKSTEWIAEMKKNGYDITAVACDVADFDSCTKAVAEVHAKVGAVDILVNNAGITRDAPFHKMTPEKWNEVIDTNLSGLFNMTHCVWNGMRDRSFGRIVNISSINGQKGQFAQANYAAAKAGDIGFTKSLALEGARKNITVNVVAPGYINTEMMSTIPEKVMNETILPQIPVGRLGEADEIARCVVFLASDDAGYITGSTLSANGGQYMD